jgi:hypothetical protein
VINIPAVRSDRLWSVALGRWTVMECETASAVEVGDGRGLDFTHAWAATQLRNDMCTMKRS